MRSSPCGDATRRRAAIPRRPGRAIGSGHERGAHAPRRRGPDDHTQPARRLQRAQRGAAAASSARSRRQPTPRSRRRAHRCREGVLRGRICASTRELRVGRRRARGDLPPEHPADPRAREAGDRGGERAAAGAGLSLAMACDVRVAASARASSPASSGSGSCPTPAGRGFSTACSGSRARSSGCARTGGSTPTRRSPGGSSPR